MLVESGTPLSVHTSAVAHTGVVPVATSLLVARGDITDLFCASQLRQHAHVLGPMDPDRIERGLVSVGFGTQKEGYAIEAAVRALEHLLCRHIIEETGFTICHSDSR